jgi:hypothetical protein
MARKQEVNLESFNEVQIAVLLTVIFAALAFSMFFVFSVSAATPDGPDALTLTGNETKGSVSAKMINISGGRIATFNLSATVKNTRWKGFVGNVTGSLTLDDAVGSTLFDWSLSSITGKVYATRSINCSNTTNLELENYRMNHTNADDNITKTFNATLNSTNATVSGGHSGFYAGNVYIYNNTCPVLHTYVGNASQGQNFTELALFDGYNFVYSTILESNARGFDDQPYDFQMIVPEIGLQGFSSATAYYIYVELGS